MNPEIPRTPQEALEAKLTALLLGELPPDEAFTLGRSIEKDPELASLYARLKEILGLVREAAGGPSEQSYPSPTLKLSEPRRERLLAHFKTVVPKEFAPKAQRETSWIIPVGIAAALLAVMGAMLLPTLSKSKSRSMRESYAIGQSLQYAAADSGGAREKERLESKTASIPLDDSPKLEQRLLSLQQPPASGAMALASTNYVSGGTAWHSKQGNLGLVDDSVAQFSRSHLQEALKNSAESGGARSDGVGGVGGAGLAAAAVPSTSTAGGIVLPSSDVALNISPQTPSREEMNAFRWRSGLSGAAAVPPEAQAINISNALAPAIDPRTGYPIAPDSEIPAIDPTTGLPVAPRIITSAAASPFKSSEKDFPRRYGLSRPSTNAEIATRAPQPMDYDRDSFSKLIIAQNNRTYPTGAYYGRAIDEGLAKPEQKNSPASAVPSPAPSFPSNTSGATAAVLGKPSQVYSLNSVGFATTNPASPTEAVSAQTLTMSQTDVSRAYLDAKRKLENLQREGQLLQMKQQSERIDVNLPKTSMVEIVDQASPEPNQSSGLFEKIRQAVTGGVERTARIKLEPDQADISGLSERSFASHYDPYFIQSEFEVIQSDAVLGKAIKDLNLDEAWGKKRGKDKKLSEAETLALLRKRLDLKPLRNTSLIEIRGKGENSEEAAKIVNAVAKAYKDHRVEQRLAMSHGGVEALEERFKNQQKDIEVAQQKLDDLRRQLHLPDAVVNADRPLLSSETLRQIEAQRIEGNSVPNKSSEQEVQKGAAATAASEEIISAGVVNFAATDANEVLKIYSELVGRQILSSSNLPHAQIALRTQAPLTRQQALQTLDAALALNGISMIPVGDKFVKPVRSPQANQAGSAADISRDNILSWPTSSNITQIVQLRHVKPSELVAALGQVTSLTNSALSLDSSRMLVLTDSPENLKRTLALITKVDMRMGTAGSTLETEIRHALTDEADEATRIRPKGPTPEPQPEVQTSQNAFSTFSLNVSDVSFKLAAASLEKGQMPEPVSIRSEEFINAFDYRDPEPPSSVPVAFNSERARYPFAHNRDLLRFSIKTAAAGRQPGRPLNIVLLLDNSGSMERADRVQIIHEALHVLAGQLQPPDKLSVVTFARTARLLVDGVSGDRAGKVADEIGGLTPQGGTNLEEAMNLAYQTAARHYLAYGINRVVLLTDGAANLGDVEPESLKQKVEAQRKQGIALDCFGIGWEGFNDDLLEVLSRNGDGRYGFINTPEEAATEFAGQLVGALHTAASDVKVQVEFNPNRVTSYRQLGYAKHQLTKEQFRDNTVDAAEIGAAESGNALYAVETNPAGEGPLAIVRVRYKIPGTTDYREHEWAVPYTGNAISMEQASPAMRLAATASAFSEWLAGNPYAAEVTLDRLIGYLTGVPEVYGADARPKKLEWMLRQAKSLAGK